MSKPYMTRGCIGLIGILIAMCMQSPVLHADTPPPQDAVTAALGFTPAGITWLYKVWAHGRAVLPHMGDQATKQNLEDGIYFTERYDVLEESTDGGKPVHRVITGKGMIRLMDKATGNWRAVVRMHKDFTYDKATDETRMTISEGAKLFSASPYMALYDFPLWVGKSWQTSYTLSDHRDDTTTEHVWQGKVTAYEDVTVPAGSFKVFKVEGKDSNRQVVSWYAPTRHLVVKSFTAYLPGHALSPGQIREELVEHTAQ